MVPEPTHSAVQVAVAGFSATVLTITGVTFHGLLWGMLGAVVMLMISAPQGRGKAIAAVFCGAMGGAVLSDMVLAVVLSYTSAPDKLAESVHLGMAFIIGGGLKPIFSALINMVVSRIGVKGAAQ